MKDEKVKVTKEIINGKEVVKVYLPTLEIKLKANLK